MATVSIIIPVFNVSKYLADCIESVLEQTHKDIEIILVDDGSTDNSLSICNRYLMTDNRIFVVRKKNGGVVSARKAGIEVAKGEYIMFVDGDDLLPKDSVMVLHRIIQDYHPDIVLGGYTIFHDSINRLEVLPKNYDGYYSKQQIESDIYPILIQSPNATYFPPQQWAKAFKRELICECQNAVDNRIKLGEDGACVITSVYNAESLYITSENTYLYRYNPQSITKNKKPFCWDGPRLIHKHIERNIDIDLFDFREQLYRKTTHELFHVVKSQFYQAKPYKLVKSEILQELSDPTYNTSIKHSSFKGIKAIIMSYALKRRLLFAIYLYSKIS